MIADADIHPTSTDIAVPGFPLGDDIDHGTAGVVAAERNGRADLDCGVGVSFRMAF